MRFVDLAIEITVLIIKSPWADTFVSGRVTHPVACFGQPDVDFEKLRNEPEVYQRLVAAAQETGHQGLLHIYVGGSIELSHMASNSWKNNHFTFTLKVDQLGDILQVR